MKRGNKSMTLEGALRAPQRSLAQCRSLSATVPGQGHWIAFLACLVLLLLPSVTLPATVEGVSDGDTEMTLTAKAAGFLPLLGIHAQAIAYGADPGKLPTKGATEFFQEFLDLLLKVLVSVNVVVTILAVVRLRLDQWRVARRQKELQCPICPNCYNLVRRRNATLCPYCRAELAPDSRIAASSPRPAPVRDEPAHREPVRRTQPLPPVREEPIRKERRKAREFAGPIGEIPARHGAALKERVCEEPLRDGLQEREGKEWEEEEWEPDEWEREERARRRKEVTYVFVFACVVGWVAVALVVLLRLV